MKAIGGYFGLELRTGAEFHPDALRLNTGRNALEYILKAKGYSRIYLPHYTCHVLLQPVQKLGLAYEFYHIDERLEPVFDLKSLQEGEAFLYTNYFGLKDAYIRSLGHTRGLIVDNAQAFYARPLPGVDTFYSARKFFGVPDGAYLYTDKQWTEQPEPDYSYGRCAHLLIRVDQDAESGYPHFTEADEALDHNPVRSMSELTRALMGSIDYEAAAAIRRRNFRYLHEALSGENGFEVPEPGDAVPMIYPFLTSDAGLRSRLIASRIYVARYWPEVCQLVGPGTAEHRFASDLIPLPIDQRLDITALDFIIKTIKACTLKVNT